MSRRCEDGKVSLTQEPWLITRVAMSHQILPTRKWTEKLPKRRSEQLFDGLNRNYGHPTETHVYSGRRKEERKKRNPILPASLPLFSEIRQVVLIPINGDVIDMRR
ncbi:hypothetical protein CEXT_642221 [Caerostris extrusa]|uniref:Uncharacterized protein n=1 Tax=Caerostris extrusa TaxID=172846 RepID=A0AAV4WC18_CAEEX|nr:hypothetical protein CEXT_642221 [Caerostris extrusa]